MEDTLNTIKEVVPKVATSDSIKEEVVVVEVDIISISIFRAELEIIQPRFHNTRPVSPSIISSRCSNPLSINRMEGSKVPRINFHSTHFSKINS